MDLSTVVNYLRTALLCLAFLVGIVLGVMMLSRKKKVPGIMALVGFLFLGLDDILTLVSKNLLATSTAANLSTYNGIVSCCSGALSVLGVIAILAALLTGILPKTENKPEAGGGI